MMYYYLCYYEIVQQQRSRHNLLFSRNTNLLYCAVVHVRMFVLHNDNEWC
jgi:hypothetical protein